MPEKKPICFFVTKQGHSAIRQQATKSGVTISDFLRELVAERVVGAGDQTMRQQPRKTYSRRIKQEKKSSK